MKEIDYSDNVVVEVEAIFPDGIYPYQPGMMLVIHNNIEVWLPKQEVKKIKENKNKTITVSRETAEKNKMLWYPI